MSHRPIPNQRARLALCSLLLATTVCLAMLVYRGIGFGQWRYGFLPGNLVLAWIPLIFASVVYSMRLRGSRKRLLLAFCALIWFLFYPNAPYLITDLIHLKTRPPIPRWFDLVLMMSFAWTGLFLGNASLYLMHEIVRNWRGRLAGWIFAVGMLILGTVGVYVGRFWRWNSWEAITRPIGLASDAMRQFQRMPAHEAALFAVTFFAFSAVTYFTLHTFANLHDFLDSPYQPAGNPTANGEKPVAADDGLR